MKQIDSILARHTADEAVALMRARQLEEALNEARVKVQLIQAKIAAVREVANAIEPSGEQGKGAKKEGGRRSRPLSDHWKQMMATVHALGSFDYSDLERAAAAIGHSVGRDTLRSQMSTYKSLEFVEPAEGRKFRLTPKGLKAASIEEAQVASEPIPKNQFEQPQADTAAAAVGAWGKQPSLTYLLSTARKDDA